LLVFDALGHLTPYEGIPLEETTVAQYFATNPTRRRLWANYLAWVAKLKAAVTPGGFWVWLGGSFVTQAPRPADLDLVLFIDHQTAADRRWLLGDLTSPDQRLLRGLDVYWVAVYPPKHRLHGLTQLDTHDWQQILGYGKADRHGQRPPKGLVQIDYPLLTH
jgi:hypothetical protein